MEGRRCGGSSTATVEKRLRGRALGARDGDVELEDGKPPEEGLEPLRGPVELRWAAAGETMSDALEAKETPPFVGRPTAARLDV